ncbi:4Fe-4S dicluster domain-containing protein [Ammoniphilus sp. YIM 78166]|uniref:4Fe-4S dicluster domain-containing protein n=1 Tax=Ammoniphilus sp. YIM 78166 TaxID=1644106 RepID=UPI00106FB06D|nr:4Fe-4S dicluster domain-containing protein [Ammoniphilus sp. YIM 78166]
MSDKKGMFIDTSVCTGCKGCQVACKEWNKLPMADEIGLTGNSYDNTGSLSAVNWRHVKFIEQFSDDRSQERWLFMTDSCKHCQQAGCMEVCPTNAIIRTEFDTVYIDHDICIGCRYCVSGCPFGVISVDDIKGTAQKCTLCYDRLQDGQQPACAQTCPTDCIQFGDVDDLMKQADTKLELLKLNGNSEANIYGKSDVLGGLNVFYLLMDQPSVYALPENPQLPSKKQAKSYFMSVFGLIGIGLVGLLTFRANRMKQMAEDQHQIQG